MNCTCRCIKRQFNSWSEARNHGVTPIHDNIVVNSFGIDWHPDYTVFIGGMANVVEDGGECEENIGWKHDKFGREMLCKKISDVQTGGIIYHFQYVKIILNILILQKSMGTCLCTHKGN